jgi:hypothetical protein
MSQDHRWLKSAVATAASDTQVNLPWARQNRRRPAAMKPMATPAPKPVALAAR